MLTNWHLNEKSREVCIKARSPSASLAFIGQVTRHISWMMKFKLRSADCVSFLSFRILLHASSPSLIDSQQPLLFIFVTEQVNGTSLNSKLKRKALAFWRIVLVRNFVVLNRNPLYVWLACSKLASQISFLIHAQVLLMQQGFFSFQFHIYSLLRFCKRAAVSFVIFFRARNHGGNLTQKCPQLM